MGVDWIGILFLFPLAAALIYLRRKESFLTFPSLFTVPSTWTGRLISLFWKMVPLLLLSLLLFLAAGPRFPKEEASRYGFGSDIVFILDESGSMSEAFGEPAAWQKDGTTEVIDKFSAAKSLLAKFMEKRKTGQDRYALTVFGSSAVPVLPLTFQHELFLSSLQSQQPVLQSTVFAHPLALALGELMNSTARSRIIVLLSDGEGPLDDDRYGFSEIIREYGIRFYWISIAAENFEDLSKFLSKIGPLGKKIDTTSAPELEAGLAEIHRLERSLILYTSSEPTLSSRPFVYLGLFLMALLWSSHSLFIYDRRS